MPDEKKRVLSEETRRKMSEAKKGLVRAQTTRDAISIARGGGNHRVVVKEPEWLRSCAPDSFVNTKDIFAIFGFASGAQLHHAVESGRFPRPTSRTAPLIRSNRSASLLLWTVLEIRKEFKRRLSLQLAGETEVSARIIPGAGESFSNNRGDMPKPLPMRATPFKGKSK